MNKNKVLAKTLCASMMLSNITSAFATVTNETSTFDDTTESATKQTEVLYNKAGNYFVTIPKTISLGADKQSPYSVKVEGDIPSDKRVYVSPIDSIKDTEDLDFYMHDTNTANPKADVVATVTQNKFYWNFSEVANGYTETNNKVTALDLTSGTWKGTFDFEINMHKVDLDIDNPKPNDFTLTTDGNVTLSVGEVHQLNAYIDGIESNSDVIWSCNNGEVTINNGLIELPSTLEVGSELTITVSKDGKEASFVITVSEAIPDFELTTDGDVTLPMGETHQLNAYIDGIESNDDVVWTCDNDEVTINNGLIELPSTLEVGSELTITASKNGKVVSFIITVSEEEAVEIKDWTYTLNDEDKTITLIRYVGTDTDVTVYNKYKSGNTIYRTKIASYDTNIKPNEYMFSYNAVERVYFEAGIDTSETKSMKYMFQACTSLTSVDFSNLDTSNVIDMRNMFYCCWNLTNVSKLDTSSVTDMREMFYECKSLTSLDVSSFDTSNVIYMTYVFFGCTSLTNIDLSNFDTSSVTNMNGMFYQCKSLTSLDVSSFDTSNVTDMRYMFGTCSSLTSLDISNFDTSRVTNMSYMFENCTALENLNLSDFDTSKVTTMQGMFSGCTSLISVDLSDFDTSNVTDMQDMFSGCTSLISVDLSKFDTSSVTNMVRMFNGCTSLISVDLSNFDTSKVKTMQSMFRDCTSLTILDLSNFNTSNVRYMTSMFYNCTNLQTIYVTKNKWSTSQASTSDMFTNCGTSSVTYK